MGVCCKCKNNKSESQFAWRNKKLGLRQGACRECMALYHKNNYSHWKKTRDPEDERERQRVKIRRAREYVFKYKSTHACIDCGLSNPVVLDFDHVDKSGGWNQYTRIAKLIGRGYSTERIQKEIDKCVVRCTNCHRIKTAKE